MITFVCFKWRPVPGYRSKFDASTVIVLRNMVRRHYAKKHRFVCVTDDGTGLPSDIEVVPLWSDFASVPSPHGGRNPSCYRRLPLFARDARKTFGERVVALDLDCVITDDIAPLFAGNEDFKIWGDTARGTPYNGSLFMLRTGAHPEVLETFDKRVSPSIGRRRGYIGSDQAWYAVALGADKPRWSKADGVYSFRNQVVPPRGNGKLPPGARIVMFHGCYDPWVPSVQMLFPWVRTHYQ